MVRGRLRKIAAAAWPTPPLQGSKTPAARCSFVMAKRRRDTMRREPVLLAEQLLPQTATPDAPEALPSLVYDVVRHRGHWRVLHAGKHSLPHASQDAAIDAVMKV